MILELEFIFYFIFYVSFSSRDSSFSLIASIHLLEFFASWIVYASQASRNVSAISKWASVDTEYFSRNRFCWVGKDFLFSSIVIFIFPNLLILLFASTFVLFILSLINLIINYRLTSRFFIENNISTNVTFLCNRIEWPINLVSFTVTYHLIFFWIYISHLLLWSFKYNNHMSITIISEKS